MKRRSVYVGFLILIFVFAGGIRPKTPADIVAMATAEDTGHHFAWYSDQTVSSGTSDDLDRYRRLYPYVLPPGKTPKDIVGIACRSHLVPDEKGGLVGGRIRERDKKPLTIVYYRDGTYSIGLSNNLASYRGPRPYTLPAGKTPNDIVDVAAVKDQLSLYILAWYRDGTVSGGVMMDLDSWREPYQYVLPLRKGPDDIVGIGIAPDTGHVFVWYRDLTVSSGVSDHLDRHRPCYSYELPQD